eukprot:7302928-Prymnesium_polylepis.1
MCSRATTCFDPSSATDVIVCLRLPACDGEMSMNDSALPVWLVLRAGIASRSRFCLEASLGPIPTTPVPEVDACCFVASASAASARASASRVCNSAAASRASASRVRDSAADTCCSSRLTSSGEGPLLPQAPMARDHRAPLQRSGRWDLESSLRPMLRRFTTFQFSIVSMAIRPWDRISSESLDLYVTVLTPRLARSG